ncbi:MAG: glutamine synthetase family protein [Chloroflexota bacterium]
MIENSENSINYVMKKASENDVKFVRLWFPDIFGNIKGFGITVDELEKVLKDGASFDGAAIFGSERSKETEMVAFPDPSTFQILPWRPEGPSVSRLLCDILHKDGTPSALDSRNILKSTLIKLKEEKLDFYVAPEIEYFYLEDSVSMTPIDDKTYFDQIGTQKDSGSDLRRKTVLDLEKMGIPIQKYHHEVGPGQQEISLRYNDAITMADNIQTFKIVVKEVAMSENVFATFMPKPFSEFEGSGMHTHISLFKNNKNVFANEKSISGISKQGEYFTAGLLKHVKEFMIITNQWVNSYSRTAASNESPSHVYWSTIPDNGNLVTIPNRRSDSKDSSRIEFRLPDPGCNPYLTFAAIITAGLKGMKEKYPLEKPMESAFNKLDEKKITSLKRSKRLPENLGLAIQYAETSKFLEEILGKAAFEVYISGKKREWQLFSEQVSEFELEHSINL